MVISEKMTKGKRMIKTISLCIMVSLFTFITAGLICAEENTDSFMQTEPSDRCLIVPKEDTCKGNFHIYYFDAPAGKCKEIWGCYDAVFNSMKECKTLCETQEETPIITESVLKNSEYYLLFGDRTINLKDGEYKSGNTPEDYISVRITNYAIGDLNKDGKDDAVVILLGQGMGSGGFYELTALIDDIGKINQTNSIVLGDRIVIRSISIKSDEIAIEMIAHNDNDPLCCPTKKMVKHFKHTGGRLDGNDQK